MVSNSPERTQSDSLDSSAIGAPPAKTIHTQVGSTASGTTRPRRQRDEGSDAASVSSSKSKKKDRFESFQDVIMESMQENQRIIRRSRLEQDSDFSNSSILMDTMKDITTAASGTIASIKQWANKSPQHRERMENFSRSYERNVQNYGPDASNHSSIMQVADCMPNDITGYYQGDRRIDEFGVDRQVHSQKNSILQDLAWPFAVCGIDVPGNLPQRDDLAPHIRKMKDAVANAVNGDINKAANDIWKFAAASKDEDDNTVGTFDTLQEENNQIRRLGSWGTVGTAGTNGTCDTGFNSLEPTKTPDEIRFALEDDDGNAIDPVLFEKTQKYRERRTPRREKLVKFAYPPIKSLRQCPRPNPEDLPNLFFTEHELDQIEDDRYSTMSTDDIEIVAVASKTSESEAPPPPPRFSYKSPRPKQGATFADSPVAGHSLGPSNGREPPEAGWKQTKGRPSTPRRRRSGDDRRPIDDEDSDFATSDPKSPSNNGRLVKGVQIYLRERSTGA